MTRGSCRLKHLTADRLDRRPPSWQAGREPSGHSSNVAVGFCTLTGSAFVPEDCRITAQERSGGRGSDSACPPRNSFLCKRLALGLPPHDPPWQSSFPCIFSFLNLQGVNLRAHRCRVCVFKGVCVRRRSSCLCLSGTSLFRGSLSLRPKCWATE